MLNKKKEICVLVVCLGNICRSPALEVILKNALRDQQMMNVHVESRGLSEKQRGKSVDEKVAKELMRRGYTVSEAKVSMPISEADFYQADYILAADERVLALLREKKPSDAHTIIELASHWSQGEIKEIPDPYRGGDEMTVVCVNLAEQYAQDIVRFLRNM